jgi:uncharacterized RDD family membrane protein YckC
MAMTTESAPPAAPAPVLRGGFWERSLAYVVDGCVLLVPTIIVNVVINNQSGAFGVNLLISLVYFSYFWSSMGGGQTLGMRVFGLRVVKDDGTPLSIVVAVVRWFGLLVSIVALGIGVFWVAFSNEKKGWHDLIAGTSVLMQEPAPYPVHVSWETPPTNGRFWAIPVVGILARVILLIPHLAVLYFVGICVYAAALVLWIPVLMNGRYPAWGYRLVGGYIRWQARLTAYMYGLTDRYPTPFDRFG